MRNVNTPEARRRRRRQAARLDRRQERLSGPVTSRVVQRYGVQITIYAADDWNRSSCRRALAENSCPLDRCAVTVETRPVRDDVLDDGVIVVTFAADGDVNDVINELAPELMAMMDAKFGPLGWLPSHDHVFSDDRRA